MINNSWSPDQFIEGVAAEKKILSKYATIANGKKLIMGFDLPHKGGRMGAPRAKSTTEIAFAFDPPLAKATITMNNLQSLYNLGFMQDFYRDYAHFQISLNKFANQE